MTTCVICLHFPPAVFLREQVGATAFPVCQDCLRFLEGRLQIASTLYPLEAPK